MAPNTARRVLATPDPVVVITTVVISVPRLDPSRTGMSEGSLTAVAVRRNGRDARRGESHRDRTGPPWLDWLRTTLLSFVSVRRRPHARVASRIGARQRWCEVVDWYLRE